MRRGEDRKRDERGGEESTWRRGENVERRRGGGEGYVG